MINFYPGPSKINSNFHEVVAEINTSQLSAFNHRSKPFMEAYALSQKSIKTYLDIPEAYEVVFLSSATECWEVIPRQFKEKHATFINTGSFAKKWQTVGTNLFKKADTIKVNLNEPLEKLESCFSSEVIAYVDCETSNGCKIPLDLQEKIKKNNPDSLIFVDATSSLGGTPVDVNAHDITFASVQKCLGLPPGLAVMILSPKAILEIRKTPTSYHYNDLNKILDNHFKQQTTHTPNTQLILTIGQLFKNSKADTLEIKEHKILLDQAIKSNNYLTHYISENKNRSDNVFCLTCQNPALILSKANKKGLLLGKGYGSLTETTFRIANFPAHTTLEIEKLCNFISSCTT